MTDKDAPPASAGASAHATAETPRDRALAIVVEVCARHSVTLEQVLAPDGSPGARRRPIVRARHEAIVVLGERMPTWSTTQIGNLFGGRDHTSILHARHAHAARIANEGGA